MKKPEKNEKNEKKPSYKEALQVLEKMKGLEERMRLKETIINKPSAHAFIFWFMDNKEMLKRLYRQYEDETWNHELIDLCLNVWADYTEYISAEVSSLNWNFKNFIESKLIPIFDHKYSRKKLKTAIDENGERVFYTDAWYDMEGGDFSNIDTYLSSDMIPLWWWISIENKDDTVADIESNLNKIDKKNQENPDKLMHNFRKDFQFYLRGLGVSDNDSVSA